MGAECAAAAVKNRTQDASEDSNGTINIPYWQLFASLHPSHSNCPLWDLMRLQKGTTGMKGQEFSPMGGSHEGLSSEGIPDDDAPPSYEVAISTGFLADAARSTGIALHLSQPLGSGIAD